MPVGAHVVGRPVVAATTPPPAAAETMVALTDLALGVEAAVCTLIVARDRRRHGSRLWAPIVTFFGATAAASLTGAALHGLTADRADPRRRALWRASLGAIGLAAVSSWWLGARLALARGAGAAVTHLAILAHLPYAALVAGSDAPFRVAVAAYVPGALFLGGSLLARLRDRPSRGPAALALTALGVTFAAAGVQVRGIGVSRRFDHNALYHSLQAIGVALFLGAAQGLLDAEARRAGEGSRPDR